MGIVKAQSTRAAAGRPPVVIVPGSLHSRLLVRTQRKYGPCDGTDGSTVLAYINWTQWQSPHGQRCWIDAFALSLDAEGRFVSKVDGVNVSVLHGPGTPNFGSLDALPTCDPWTCPSPSAYQSFVSMLISKGGYAAGRDLLFAPYDWRSAPGLELDPFCIALATLIERTASLYGAVVLAGHSAGPALIGYCLRRQPAAWRRANVHGMLSLNGLVAGEIDCLETLWHGGDFNNAAGNVSGWDTRAYRRTQWTWGVTSWCLPQQSLYGSRALLQVGHVNYSAEDLTDAFPIFAPNAQAVSMKRVWSQVHNVTSANAAPGTRVWCLYGTGVPTPVHYAFPEGFNRSRPARPVVTMGDGDGQQPTESNGACVRWRGAGEQVDVQTFGGADHDSILSDDRVHQFVLEHVLKVS